MVIKTIKENFDIKILVHNMVRVINMPLTLLRELIFDVYLLSDNNKKVTYVASRSVGMESYIIERICGKGATILKIKSVYIWELKNFVDKQDAVLIDTHKTFLRFFKGGFLMSSWVRQVMDIDIPIDEAIKLDNRELRKVYQYGYEVSHDPEALKFYYEKMYSPHIKRKYGKVTEFIYFKKFFRNGELVFVKLNGERVSAALCLIDKDGYHLHSSGIIDENFIKDGALLATYYFSILRAKEVNAKIFDLGLSRPFLSDGVLKHKNNWGAKICEYKTTQRFMYVKNILFEQPFIYLDNGKLKAAIFSENDKFKKAYANSGLEFKVIDKSDKNINSLFI